MSKVLCVLVLVLAMGCKLAPNAQDVGQDEAFVSDGLTVVEDKFTRLRTSTGPEYMSKESKFAPEANWIRMRKVERLDGSTVVYQLIVRTYHSYGRPRLYTSAYDDTGAKLDAKLKGAESQEELTLIHLTQEDIRRFIDRETDTSIKLLGESDEMIFLLPRSYVVDFMAATR